MTAINDNYEKIGNEEFEQFCLACTVKNCPVVQGDNCTNEDYVSARARRNL